MRRTILLALVWIFALSALRHATANAAGTAAEPEVRCDDSGCALSACATRRLLANPNSQLGPIRLVPQVRDGQPLGFKVFALPPQGLLSQLGLRSGDWVTAVNGRLLTSPESALAIWTELKAAELVTVAVDRRDEPLTFKIRMDPRTPAAGECPLPPPSPASPASRPPLPPPTLRSLRKDLRCKAARCVLKRSVFESLLANTSLWLDRARIVPAVEGGRPIGFRLVLQPGSLWSLLGFHDGDLVQAINELPLDSPDHALEAYSRLRNVNPLRVQLLRNGNPAALTFVIR